MLFKSLGTLDLITVLILIGAAILPQKLLLGAAFYLLIKASVFILLSKDFASYGDFVAGLYLLVLSFGIKIPYMHNLVLFYLLQKTILTFIAIGLKLFLFYQEYKEELPSFLK